MSRLERQKRILIEEANKRILGENTGDKYLSGDLDGDGIPNRLDIDADGELDNVDYITDLWVNYNSADAPLHWINKRNAGFRTDIFTDEIESPCVTGTTFRTQETIRCRMNATMQEQLFCTLHTYRCSE